MEILFILFAAIAVAGALNVILQRNPIYSAIGLIVTLCALAGLFLTLAAQFIAAIADGSLVVIAPATTWTDTVTALDRAVLGLPLTPRDRHALATIARNIMSSTSCYAD